MTRLQAVSDRLIQRFEAPRSDRSSMLQLAMHQWRERDVGPWAVIDKLSGAWIGEIGRRQPFLRTELPSA